MRSFRARRSGKRSFRAHRSFAGFNAQLQAAFLQGAQLEGSSLGFAQLEGAWLFGAQLQSASLNAAQLEGATLDDANLEGASLDYANLQGASLQQARLHATSLSMAFLWRTNRADRIPGSPNPSAPSVVALPDAPDHWLPIWRDGQGKVHPWNGEVYSELRRAIESLPEGIPRSQALESIRRADCASSDLTLASCDPSVPPPAEAAAWRKALGDAVVDDATYAKALTAALKTLVCSGDDDAIYVLRGLESALNGRLANTGREAPALVDFIMSKDCPVSASLSNDDKAKLQRIKQDAIKNSGG